MAEPAHGTFNRYAHRSCRCPECREAARIQSAAQRARGSLPERTSHGTISAYFGYSCRCDLCRAAGSAYLREYRAQRAAREA